MTRRLTDVTITTADRPAPPREKAPRRAARASAPRPARRHRILPGWMRRVLLAAASLAGLGMAGAGILWSAHSGVLDRVARLATQDVIALSQRAGLRVAEVNVDGRKRIPAQDLLTALAIERDAPILGLDLDAARARVAAIPGVQSVTIERRLPSEVHVFVAEREPVAIWQNDGRYQLIDRAGLAAGENIDDFPGLPLVVGPEAPSHVAALLDLLASEPTLRPRVRASQWVSDRRWTILVNGPVGDIEVRLPESDFAAAWHQLAHLETEQKLLDRKITAIDMRLPDRLVLRIPGGTQQPAKSGSTPVSPARRKAAGRDA